MIQIGRTWSMPLFEKYQVGKGWNDTVVTVDRKQK